MSVHKTTPHHVVFNCTQFFKYCILCFLYLLLCSLNSMHSSQQRVHCVVEKKWICTKNEEGTCTCMLPTEHSTYPIGYAQVINCSGIVNVPLGKG